LFSQLFSVELAHQPAAQNVRGICTHSRIADLKELLLLSISARLWALCVCSFGILDTQKCLVRLPLALDESAFRITSVPVV
jgi:hypothetical protein